MRETGKKSSRVRDEARVSEMKRFEEGVEEKSKLGVGEVRWLERNF